MSIADVLDGSERWTIEQGDCLDVLRSMPDACVDAMVTDPPCGIGFMGRKWDSDRGGRDPWVAWLAARMREAYRVMKPGAHGVVWALPRTCHWTAYALEDAGFEIVDRKSHVFGSGFPKSVDVAKAIDKMRDDDVRPVCRFLRAAMFERGVSSAAIAESFGFHSRMVDHWAASETDSQPTCPTLEQWEKLRELLGFGPGMDAEVARLNARKGEAGDAWRDAKIVGEHEGNLPGLGGERFGSRDKSIREPSEDAKLWAGWGTALKPAVEDWWLVRKPRKGTIARNVLEHGTGALNIDGCRVPHASAADLEQHAAGVAAIKERGGSMDNSWKNTSDLAGASDVSALGRWPAHLMLSHAEGCLCVGTVRVKAPPAWHDTADKASSLFTGEATSTVRHAEGDGFETVKDWRCMPWCPVRILNDQSGECTSGIKDRNTPNSSWAGGAFNAQPARVTGGDSGGASRYFTTFAFAPFYYTPKAARADREKGCEHLPIKSGAELTDSKEGAARLASPRTGAGRLGGRRNTHPTVKSTELMRHLCRLVTPPGGIVVDLFAGSGSTGVGCSAEGFRFIGIEAEAESVEIARARIVGDAPLLNASGAR